MSKYSTEKENNLEDFIDFAESVIENDEIEEIIDENGEVVLKIPVKEEENIYRQSEKYVRDLRSNLMEKDILYKEKAPSARHSGLRPLRIAILTLFNESSKIAERKHLIFYGLTLYELQKAMKPCNVSNHTIKDNLRKLVDLGLVKKKNITVKGKSAKTTFYDIKVDSYPCKDGAYILWDKDFRGRGLYVIACPKYPFCSLKKEDCRILDHLVKLVKILPQHIRGHGIEVEDIKMDLPEEFDVEEDVEFPSVEIRQRKKPKKKYNQASGVEKNAIGKMIKELRQDAENPKSIKECIEEVLELFEVDIEINDIYNLLKNLSTKEQAVTKPPEEIKIEKTNELEMYRNLSETKKKQVEERVLSIVMGDLPRSSSWCVDVIKEELRVIVNEYNISVIVKNHR